MTKAKKTNANQMWGGHYTGAPDQLLQKINSSIGFDQKLYAQDIQASIVHTKMLVKQKIIDVEDGNNIVDGLVRIKKDIEDDKVLWREELEDIHMNIEARLKKLAGDSAGRLHTARSRNDQVATDFKLWVADSCYDAMALLTKISEALLAKAEEYHDTIMPGFTHLQSAQPVTFGHHLMAYYEMFQRDFERILDAEERLLKDCPLGAAALAGTSFPIDREYTAQELGFAAPSANSLDAVSDRDFALEYLAAASICMMHLSRLAEELVIWTSKQFGFVNLPEEFTTGSSIMPQKRNPDAAELVRGKTGRTYGNLISLLTTMKGLPLAYNKDSQEDKEPVFDTSETLANSLAVMIGMIEGLTADKEKMLEAAKQGFPTATDFADWLVREIDVPFREAHHITGKAVVKAEEKNCGLEDLSLEELQEIEPKITEGIFEVLTVENSVKSRKSYGGTAPENVLEQIKKAREN